MARRGRRPVPSSPLTPHRVGGVVYLLTSGEVAAITEDQGDAAEKAVPGSSPGVNRA